MDKIYVELDGKMVELEEFTRIMKEKKKQVEEDGQIDEDIRKERELESTE